MDDVEGFALLLALCCSHSLAGFEFDAKIAVRRFQENLIVFFNMNIN